MRKYIMSLFVTMFVLAMSIAPVLADTIGPTPK